MQKIEFFIKNTASAQLCKHQFNSIQFHLIKFNSLFHFTQGNTILTVYQIIYINNQCQLARTRLQQGIRTCVSTSWGPGMSRWTTAATGWGSSGGAGRPVAWASPGPTCGPGPKAGAAASKTARRRACIQDRIRIQDPIRDLTPITAGRCITGRSIQKSFGGDVSQDRRSQSLWSDCPAGKNRECSGG